MNTSTCHACDSGRLVMLLDAGMHPVANKFLTDRDAPEQQFSLVLGQCTTCGLVQLLTSVPVCAIVPRVDWVSYNEPEGHLDAVAETICHLPGIDTASTIGAITYKDDSTLERLRRHGIARTWRLDAAVDLNAGPTAGVETVQERLTSERTEYLATKYRRADVLLVRHILEHAYDTRQFLSALRNLVRPGGYLVFEVPDETQVLDTLDYTALWEEHVLYFTPPTLQDTLVRAGFEITRFECHPRPPEDAAEAP